MLRSEEVDSTELSGGTYGNWRMEHLRESTKQREASCIEWADAIAPVMEKTYLYINGGFGTAAGMVRALDTVATVGVACIAAVEPSLPKSILSGKMKGSIRPSLDEDNPEYNM